MKKLISLLAATALLVTSCAHPQTTFKQVSTAPVHKSIQATDKKIASAQGHATKLKAQLAKIEAQVPDMKDAFAAARSEVDALTQDLLDARTQNQVTETKLKQADQDNARLVRKANEMGDRLLADEKELKLVRRWWGIGAIVYGLGKLLHHLLILAGFVLLALAIFAALGIALRNTPIGAAYQVCQALVLRLIRRK